MSQTVSGLCSVVFCFLSFFALQQSFRPDNPKLEKCSSPLYVQLDYIGMAIPIAALFLVSTPFGMRTFQPITAVMCIFVPLVTCVIAFVFSTAWDNLIASQGVWTFDADCMLGVWKSIPYEEYAWFLLHTTLGQAMLMRIHFADETPLPARPDAIPKSRWEDPIIRHVVFLLGGATVAGLLLMHGHPTLYLGVQMLFISPVLMFMTYTFGHFYRWQLSKFVLPIVLESAYTIVLDQFAISRNIWHIYDASGIRFPIYLFGNRGLQLEQVMIYSLTSVLVVGTLHPLLLICKAYYQWDVQRPFPEFMLDMVKSDGQVPEAEAHRVGAPAPCWKPIESCLKFLDNLDLVLKRCSDALLRFNEVVTKLRSFLEGLHKEQEPQVMTEPLSEKPASLDDTATVPQPQEDIAPIKEATQAEEDLDVPETMMASAAVLQDHVASQKLDGDGEWQVLMQRHA